MPDADELRAQALEVARGWSPPGAPRSWRLTAALFEAIASHDGLLDRLAALPADRLPALLGSAAIAFLVRRDRPVPLAGYFPEPGAAQPRFVVGDIIDMLPRVLARIPVQERIIVADAYTAVFLPEQRRAELADLLAEAGQRRPVTWLSLDPLVPLGPAGRDSVQGLPLPPALIRDYQHGGVFAVLGARTFDRAGDRTRLLARAHPSGQWVEWLSPRPSDSPDRPAR